MKEIILLLISAAAGIGGSMFAASRLQDRCTP